MKEKSKTFFYILVITICGCTGNIQTTSQSNINNLATPDIVSSTITVTKEMPSQTSISENLLETETPNQNINQKIKSTQTCFSIQSKNPSNFISNGYIITTPLVGSDGPFAYQINENTKIPLREDWSDYNWYFSPDYQNLAQVSQPTSDDEDEIVNFFDFSGKEIAESYTLTNNTSFRKWLNNSEILLANTTDDDLDKYSNYVYNISTGELDELLNDFPVEIDGDDIDSSSYTYNNQLTRVIFPMGATDDRLPGHILVDLQNNQDLLEINLSTGNSPSWSSNGKYFALENPSGLIYSRDGVSILDIYEYVNGYPKWSPDNSKLALWISPDVFSTQSDFSVLDIKNRSLSDFCIESKYPENFTSVWSPDGNGLAINLIRDGQNQIILIDLKSKQAFEIAKDVVLRFWVESIPSIWLEE